MEINGHDMGSILSTLDEMDQITGQPKMIIAQTIKGAGIPFAENRVEFHNGLLDAVQFETACELLGAGRKESR